MLKVKSKKSFCVFQSSTLKGASCLALQVLLILFLIVPSYAGYILFSTDEDFAIGIIQPADDNLVSYFTDTFYLSGLLPPGSLPKQVNVDAIGILSQNEIVISLDEDVIISSTLYADEDLIKFNGSTFSMWWNASGSGLPPEVNLDAVYVLSVSPQEVLFSLEEDAVLPTVGLVADEDIIKRKEGVGFSMFLDGSSIGIPPEADIDAIAKDPSTGHYIISLDSDAVIGSTLYFDADLIEYTGAGFTLYFDSAGAGIPAQVDINAAEIVTATNVPQWMIFE